MAKSIINRPDGTRIEISGTPEEIKKIISLYSEGVAVSSTTTHSKEDDTNKKTATNAESAESIVIKIVQEIRNGTEAERIEANILDQSSQVDRVLLPLYIAKKYIGNEVKMTSGNVYEVLKQLGIKMLRPNISKTLANTGSKYVIQHNVRKQGESTQYTLGLKGEKYIASLLN